MPVWKNVNRRLLAEPQIGLLYTTAHHPRKFKRNQEEQNSVLLQFGTERSLFTNANTSSVGAKHTPFVLIVWRNSNKYIILPLSLIDLLYLRFVGRDSSVGIATRYGLDGPEIESRWGQDFLHPSRPALGPTQPRVQWVPGLSWGYSDRGVVLTTHPHLATRSRKGRAIPLLTLWVSVACYILPTIWGDPCTGLSGNPDHRVEIPWCK